MIENYIGIDNGCSGSVGIISNGKASYYHTPIYKTLNYTKSKQFLNRIDGVHLKNMLFMYCENSFCYIERPFVNPGMFKATLSAVRALEATLIVLDILKIPYVFIDSKEWQKKLLPSGLHKEELKKASMDIAKRLFPSLDLDGFKDGDGMLIAEYCRIIK